MGTVELGDARPQVNTTQSRHLAIAGTGRAGTSFLVKYLTELGFDTTLARQGPERAFWDEQSHAGLEELLVGDLQDLPYVVKSPWMFQNVDQLLARPDFALDGVIIPIRSLAEAATSRVVNELYHIQQATPWMAETDQTWEVWSGTAAGGVLFSLNPLDQARILAVGFHKLIEALVAADVPVILLSFPRLVEDADYLFDRLGSVLPAAITRDQARLAHGKTADPTKIRVGKEIGVTSDAAATPSTIYSYPKFERVDTIALKREVSRLRREGEVRIESAQKDIDQKTELIGTLERAVKSAADAAPQVAAKIAQLETAVEALERELCRLRVESEARLESAQRDIDQKAELIGTLGRAVKSATDAVPAFEAKITLLETGIEVERALEAQLHASVSSLSEESASLKLALASRDRAMNDLLSEVARHKSDAARNAADFEAISNSRLWRLTGPLRRLVDAIR